MSTENIDPVEVALMQARLDHLCRHMGWVMTRTARSPIFSQSHDFSCFATDSQGVLVSTADGIPIHTGGGGFAVRAVIRDFGGDLAPGDVFVLNDPYTAGGNHLPDWVIARPVFHESELVGFCCNRAHQSDIGGGAAGTYNPEATEIFQEGIRLPPLRLVEAGEMRRDLWRLLMINTRTPELLDGDLRAMLGSTEIGSRRMAELAAVAGPTRCRELFGEICALADRRFRAEVAALPDGVWEAEEFWDDDCLGPHDSRLALRLSIDGEAVTVDFTGTSPQVRGFKNSSWVNTWSAVSMALASFLPPDLPRNEGTFRAVEMIAPEGTIVNARPPAAMTMNTVNPAHEIIHLVWRCLSRADPGRALAGWGKNLFGVTSGRWRGRPFVLYHWNAAAGGGATTERDGFNQIGHLIALGGLNLPNVELTEATYPVRIRRQEFRAGGGGQGRFRGGTGIEYEADVLVPAQWSFRGEGLGPPSGHGESGGGAGAPGEMILEPLGPDGEPTGEVLEAPRYGIRHLGPVRVTARSPGGGGVGDPALRDPGRRDADVRDGLVGGGH